MIPKNESLVKFFVHPWGEELTLVFLYLHKDVPRGSVVFDATNGIKVRSTERPSLQPGDFVFLPGTRKGFDKMVIRAGFTDPKRQADRIVQALAEWSAEVRMVSEGPVFGQDGVYEL